MASPATRPGAFPDGAAAPGAPATRALTRRRFLAGSRAAGFADTARAGEDLTTVSDRVRRAEPLRRRRGRPADAFRAQRRGISLEAGGGAPGARGRGPDGGKPARAAGRRHGLVSGAQAGGGRPAAALVERDPAHARHRGVKRCASPS